MEKFPARKTAENYWSSVAGHLRSIDREVDPARQEVVKRLQQSPLWTIMGEAYRGVGSQEESFLVKKMHDELIGSDVIGENSASTAVSNLLAGEQLWDDLKLTRTSELVKEASSVSAVESKEVIKKKKAELEKDNAEIAAELKTAEKELDKLSAADSAKLVVQLKEIGVTKHNTDKKNFELLKSNKAKLPQYLQVKVDDVSNRKGETVLGRLFGSQPSGQSILCREVEGIELSHNAGVNDLNNIIQELNGRALKNEAHLPIDEEAVFSDCYKGKLRERVFEKITGVGLDRVGHAGKCIGILQKQNEFAAELQRAFAVISAPEKLLESLSSGSVQTGSNIKEEIKNLRRSIDRLPEIEAELKALDLKTISTAGEVSSKLRRKEELAKERKEISQVIEGNRSFLPYLYDRYSDRISHEAVGKTIVGDKEKLQKVLEAYQKISNDVFGVPVERLGVIMAAHEAVIKEIDKEIVVSMDSAIYLNTIGAGEGEFKEGAYNLEDMKKFIQDGGKALTLEVFVSAFKHCTETEGRFEGYDITGKEIGFIFDIDNYRGEGTTSEDEARKLGGALSFPWQLLGHAVGRPRDYYGRQQHQLHIGGNGKIWLPVGKEVEGLRIAVFRYNRLALMRRKQRQSCDVFEGSVNVRGEILGGSLGARER